MASSFVSDFGASKNSRNGYKRGMQNRIRELRARTGLSQEKLALRLGVKKAAVSKLEKGQMQLTAAYLEKLSQALGCSPHEIYQIDTPASGAELAVIYAIKELIDMMLGRREKTRQNFIEDFGHAIEQYRLQNLPNAALAMGDLLAHVRDETPQTPQQVIRKMRQLSPPKSV